MKTSTFTSVLATQTLVYFKYVCAIIFFFLLNHTQIQENVDELYWYLTIFSMLATQIIAYFKCFYENHIQIIGDCFQKEKMKTYLTIFIIVSKTNYGLLKIFL